MASKLEIQIEQYLRSYLSSNYPDIYFEKEVPGDFDIRYDFIIPTTPPINIEVDGENHRKFNDFFFKSDEQFDKYKSNDNLRRKLHNAGNIYLINIPDNETWTYSKFKKLMIECEDILEKGISSEARKKLEEKRKKSAFFKDIEEKNKKKKTEFQKEHYSKQKEYEKKHFKKSDEQKEKEKKLKREWYEKQKEYRKKQKK